MQLGNLKCNLEKSLKLSGKVFKTQLVNHNFLWPGVDEFSVDIYLEVSFGIKSCKFR